MGPNNPHSFYSSPPYSMDPSFSHSSAPPSGQSQQQPPLSAIDKSSMSPNQMVFNYNSPQSNQFLPNEMFNPQQGPVTASQSSPQLNNQFPMNHYMNAFPNNNSNNTNGNDNNQNLPGASQMMNNLQSPSPMMQQFAMNQAPPNPLQNFVPPNQPSQVGDQAPIQGSYQQIFNNLRFNNQFNDQPINQQFNSDDSQQRVLQQLPQFLQLKNQIQQQQFMQNPSGMFSNPSMGEGGYADDQFANLLNQLFPNRNSSDMQNSSIDTFVNSNNNIDNNSNDNNNNISTTTSDAAVNVGNNYTDNIISNFNTGNLNSNSANTEIRSKNLIIAPKPTESYKAKSLLNNPEQIKKDIQRYNEMINQPKSQEDILKSKQNSKSPSPNLKSKRSIPTGAFAPKNFKKSFSPESAPTSSGSSDEDLTNDSTFQIRLKTFPEALYKSRTGENDLKMFLLNNIRLFKTLKDQETLMNRLSLILISFERDHWGKTPDWRFVCLKQIDGLRKQLLISSKHLIDFKVSYNKKNKLFNRISNWLRFDITNKSVDKLLVTLEFLKDLEFSKDLIEKYKLTSPLERLINNKDFDNVEIQHLAKQILNSGVNSHNNKKVVHNDPKRETNKPKSIVNKPKVTIDKTKSKVTKPIKSSLFHKNANTSAAKNETVKRTGLLESLLPTKKPPTVPPQHAHSASSFGQSSSFARFLPSKDLELKETIKKINSKIDEPLSPKEDSIVEVDEAPVIYQDGVKSILRRKNDEAKTKRKRRNVSLKWKTENNGLYNYRFFDFDPEERRLNAMQLPNNNQDIDKINKRLNKRNHLPSMNETSDILMEIGSNSSEISTPPDSQAPSNVSSPTSSVVEPEEDEYITWYEPIIIDFKNIPWYEFVEENCENRGNGYAKTESQELEIQLEREKTVGEVIDDNLEPLEPIDGGINGLKADSSNGLVLHAKNMVAFGTSGV